MTAASVLIAGLNARRTEAAIDEHLGIGSSCQTWERFYVSQVGTHSKSGGWGG